MGADENAEAKLKAFELSPWNFSINVLQKLDDGWLVSEQQDGQLVLIPPPLHGEPAA